MEGKDDGKEHSHRADDRKEGQCDENEYEGACGMRGRAFEDLRAKITAPSPKLAKSPIRIPVRVIRKEML